MDIFSALYMFFYEKVFCIESYTNEIGGEFSDYDVNFFSGRLSVGSYLCFVSSLISVIFILVLCCLFVYKIIKLVGNLIK